MLQIRNILMMQQDPSTPVSSGPGLVRMNRLAKTAISTNCLKALAQLSHTVVYLYSRPLIVLKSLTVPIILHTDSDDMTVKIFSVRRKIATTNRITNNVKWKENGFPMSPDTRSLTYFLKSIPRSPSPIPDQFQPCTQI